eukprot:gnl/MRDRNA2_/MRDRNA2_29685_c0_seq1.p1 gnl/MRDRNA2_/MRDRNA2_29685_c0~~gnl/MRDRNA2_/MRDRNA2_29685_c0_seq1.p1  ORF type:complete len:821 (+),score=129.58 gnl/MRDRNA2_/MRDRNA2_29685_c0_seq1:109-2571(+)
MVVKQVHPKTPWFLLATSLGLGYCSSDFLGLQGKALETETITAASVDRPFSRAGHRNRRDLSHSVDGMFVQDVKKHLVLSAVSALQKEAQSATTTLKTHSAGKGKEEQGIPEANDRVPRLQDILGSSIMQLHEKSFELDQINRTAPPWEGPPAVRCADCETCRPSTSYPRECKKLECTMIVEQKHGLSTVVRQKTQPTILEQKDNFWKKCKVMVDNDRIPNGDRMSAPKSSCEDPWSQSVGLQHAIEIIGEGAFEDCKMRYVVWSDGLREIRNKAFKNCENLMLVMNHHSIANRETCGANGRLKAFWDKSTRKDKRDLEKAITAVEEAGAVQTCGLGTSSAMDQACGKKEKLEEKLGEFARTDPWISNVLLDMRVANTEMFDWTRVTQQEAEECKTAKRQATHVKPRCIDVAGQWYFAKWQGEGQVTPDLPGLVTKLKELQGSWDRGEIPQQDERLPSNFLECVKPIFDTPENVNQLPFTLEQIGDEAFMGTKKFYQMTIPSKVLRIGKSAFKDSGLQWLTFAEDSILEEIGEEAFHGCLINSGHHELNHGPLRIPASVHTIGPGAFAMYYASEVILSPDSMLKSIPSKLFDCEYWPSRRPESWPLEDKPLRFPSGRIDTILIPPSVTEIQSSAFKGCETLATVDMKSTALTHIKENAFQGSGVTEILIPVTVKVIEAGAFMNCKSLETITFVKPKSKCELFPEDEECVDKPLGRGRRDPTYGAQGEMLDLWFKSYDYPIAQKKGCPKDDASERGMQPATFKLAGAQTAENSNEVRKQVICHMIKTDAFKGCDALKTVKYDDGEEIPLDRFLSLADGKFA